MVGLFITEIKMRLLLQVYKKGSCILPRDYVMSDVVAECWTPMLEDPVV